MTGVEWVPGAHHAIVRDGLGLLLADDVPLEQVLQVWRELERPGAQDGLGGLLDILRDVTGRGLGSLPSFAMSVADDRGLHVAARGAFNVRVLDLDAVEHVVRGDEASLWAERNFDSAAVSEVLLGPEVLDGTWLPVSGGVVPAAGVRRLLVERTAAADALPATDRADAAEVALEPEPDVEAPPGSEVGTLGVVVAAHETWVEAETPVEVSSQESPAEGANAVGPDAEGANAVGPDAEGADAVGPDAVGADAETPAPDVPHLSPAGPRRFASLLSPHTVMHDVEEAAVRPDDSHADDEEPAPEQVDEQVADLGAIADEEVPDPPTPVAAADPVGAPPAAPSPASFISGVPRRSVHAAPAPFQEARPTAAPVTAVEPDGPEHHDGHTMLEAPDSTELDAYLSESVSGPGAESVLGVLCGAGHGNPTHRTECRVCGQHLAGDSVRIPRPGLGWMHTSGGESIELVQNVLAGRNPRASRIQGTVLPRLLPLPHSHVSGTHLEIRLEGWSVMVVDLRSTNGTFLQRPGQPTLRISESPQLLHSDDVVQLGHGVDLRFEALP